MSSVLEMFRFVLLIAVAHCTFFTLEFKVYDLDAAGSGSTFDIRPIYENGILPTPFLITMQDSGINKVVKYQIDIEDEIGIKGIAFLKYDAGGIDDLAIDMTQQDSFKLYNSEHTYTFNAALHASGVVAENQVVAIGDNCDLWPVPAYCTPDVYFVADVNDWTYTRTFPFTYIIRDTLSPSTPPSINVTSVPTDSPTLKPTTNPILSDENEILKRKLLLDKLLTSLNLGKQDDSQCNEDRIPAYINQLYNYNYDNTIDTLQYITYDILVSQFGWSTYDANILLIFIQLETWIQDLEFLNNVSSNGILKSISLINNGITSVNDVQNLTDKQLSDINFTYGDVIIIRSYFQES